MDFEHNKEKNRIVRNPLTDIYFPKIESQAILNYCLSSEVPIVNAMYLYFIVICMTLVAQALGYSDTNCTLDVVNKKEFESRIIGYLDSKSDTVLLEYDLDFSHVGSDFDLVNRTNPIAFQPW
ncbi:hypothetical protein BgiMline_010235, partial [Biomphalaria glabrata]